MIPLTILVVSLVVWLVKRRRTSKLAAAAGADLVPREKQNTNRSFPDPEADAVEAALARGEWQPAAQAIAAAGTDWERRSYLVDIVADHAARDDAWLRAWQAARPDDPDAAVVRAAAQVALAWEIRTGAWAKHVTGEQAAGFLRVLAGGLHQRQRRPGAGRHQRGDGHLRTATALTTAPHPGTADHGGRGKPVPPGPARLLRSPA
ncbi:DUF4034 domain-containing protein [Streptomyces rimosus]|uniref:DUF4034 domain-containing protein n=1 Tax=Streptomyces rimosus TaxID=1927 RepID=UPI001F3C2026|nr:DUF4034 domain-containing protein [Streptomyces rimosus]